VWAIDARSKGGHCWGEFFLPGVGWVPYDTTLDGDHLDSEAYFGQKPGEVLAGMIDFDWVIDAGPFGKQTVFAVDAFPGFWSQGQGRLDDPMLQMTTRVQIIQRLR
jgi:transglutaminase-like putative cysteine protease